MENIQQFIESGILEEYVLGQLSAAEEAAVEAAAAAHPAVREELQQVEAAIGLYAEAHALAPPAGMRERVLDQVRAQLAAPTQKAGVAATAPALVAPTLTAYPTAAASEAVVRPLSSAPVAAVPTGRSVWAMAASVALLLSLGANVLLYSQWQDASADLVALQNDQARFATTTQVLEKQLGAVREQNTVLRSDDFRTVALAGTKAAPTAKARVLFNRATRQVYLDVKNLPALPAGKQYQLWALDNGKPVDAGTLATTTAVGDSLQQMKDIASAQAFAMTVEPEGGSVNPTLTTMTVIGKL